MTKTTNLAIIDFHGDELLAIENDKGKFVAIKPICESLGIGWSSQLKRIKRSTILSEAMVIMTTAFNPNGQEMVGMDINFVNGWLFGIDETRIKDENTRKQVLNYQRECYRVLYEHFNGIRNESSTESAYITHDGIQTPLSVYTAKLRTVESAKQILGIQQAQALWRELGLPVAMMTVSKLKPKQLNLI